MSKWNKWVAILCIPLFITCTGQRSERIIKLGHGLSVTHPVHEAMVYMADLVREKSNGQLEIKVYPNAQLGTERELVELLQIGSLGMTKVSAATLESFAPRVQVFSMPYIFRDDAHRDLVLKGDVGKELLLEGEQFWLRGLCYYDAGKRSFYTKQKPVETLDDIKGLKIRTLESNMAINMIKSFGSSPTPVSWGELYTALQQGIVDGAENNPPSLFTSRHYEVCKYYSINEHTAVPDVVVISTKVWNLLTDQEKKWLQEAADESADYQYQLWEKSVEESLREMEKAGVIISYPDQTPFREAVVSLYEAVKQNNPEVYRLVERIQAVQD